MIVIIAFVDHYTVYCKMWEEARGSYKSWQNNVKTSRTEGPFKNFVLRIELNLGHKTKDHYVGVVDLAVLPIQTRKPSVKLSPLADFRRQGRRTYFHYTSTEHAGRISLSLFMGYTVSNGRRIMNAKLGKCGKKRSGRIRVLGPQNKPRSRCINRSMETPGAWINMM